MDNPLSKTVSEMADDYTGTDAKQAFKDGASEALDAVRGYLIISSHLGETVKISDLQKFISRISM